MVNHHRAAPGTLKYLFNITQQTQKLSLHSTCRDIVRRPRMATGAAGAPSGAALLLQSSSSPARSPSLSSRCTAKAVWGWLLSTHRALPWTRQCVCPAVRSGSSHDPKDSSQTGSLCCLEATNWGCVLTEGWLWGIDHLEKHDVTSCVNTTLVSAQLQVHKATPRTCGALPRKMLFRLLQPTIRLCFYSTFPFYMSPIENIGYHQWKFLFLRFHLLVKLLASFLQCLPCVTHFSTSKFSFHCFFHQFFSFCFQIAPSRVLK